MQALENHKKLAKLLVTPNKRLEVKFSRVYPVIRKTCVSETTSLLICMTLLCNDMVQLFEFGWDVSVLSELRGFSQSTRNDICNAICCISTQLEDRLLTIERSADKLHFVLSSYNKLFKDFDQSQLLMEDVPGLINSDHKETTSCLWKLAVCFGPEMVWNVLQSLQGTTSALDGGRQIVSLWKKLHAVNQGSNQQLIDEALEKLEAIQTLSDVRSALGDAMADTLLKKLPQFISNLEPPHQYDYFDVLNIQNTETAQSVLVATKKRKRNAESPTPILFNEHMEFNEFAVSLGFLETVQPSANLRSLIHHWGLIRSTINGVILKLMQLQKNIRKPQVYINDEFTVKISGDLTPDKQLSKIIIGFYYHALERILTIEQERRHKLHAIVTSQAFHRGVLACVCHVVTQAIGITQKLKPSGCYRNLPIYSVLDVCDCTGYEFMKVSETFLNALSRDAGSGMILRLPKVLVQDMETTEVNILDSLVFAQADYANAMVTVIRDLQDNKLWPVPGLAPSLTEEQPTSYVQPPSTKAKYAADFKCVDYVLRKVQRLTYQRLEKMCKYLDISNLLYPTWLTFRYLLRNHIHLLFDRHVDHFVLCSIYGVSRKSRPDVKFTQIIDAYVAVRTPDLGEATCQRIVRHVKTDNNKVDTVIKFYNQVFVPVMKDQLLKMHALSATGPSSMAIHTTVAPIELGVAAARATEQANEIASSGVSMFP